MYRTLTEKLSHYPSAAATVRFWISLFFTFAGILLWRLGIDARQVVLIAAVVMASATVAATALAVMGPPATLVGVISSLVALGWTWRSRAVVRLMNHCG